MKEAQTYIERDKQTRQSKDSLEAPLGAVAFLSVDELRARLNTHLSPYSFVIHYSLLTSLCGCAKLHR